MELLLHNRIRQRAHELWNAGGRLDGQAEQHWLAAERDVLEQMSAQVRVGSTRVSTPRQRALGNKQCAAAAKEGLSKKAATAETLTI